jgi:hypothetical protein
MSADTEARAGRAKVPTEGQFSVPERLRSRLGTWIDVDEVGEPGFWRWLETVLPLLPAPEDPGPGFETLGVSEAIRLRQLARDLVDCARDRARLTVLCDRYFRDNQLLAVRLKSVEAALETTRSTGRPTDPGEDPESDDAAERYLPQR